MTAKERYESAKALYASIGVDTDKAIENAEICPCCHALLAGR